MLQGCTWVVAYIALMYRPEFLEAACVCADLQLIAMAVHNAVQCERWHSIVDSLGDDTVDGHHLLFHVPVVQSSPPGGCIPSTCGRESSSLIAVVVATIDHIIEWGVRSAQFVDQGVEPS